MKKIISVLLAASLSLSCMLTSAQAAGRVENITNALSSDEIHILYNDQVVAYEDVKPVNTGGRVMIPFRAALESMGAAVEYDETERTVTASKGDISITFALMDDTIYIDKNGEKSTITMDVPMIIVEDRVMVPIRFMSNALGMQVGWDGDSETVVIMDYDEYISQIMNTATNIEKLASYETTQFDKCTINISVNGTDSDLSGVINMLMKDGKISADGKLRVTSQEAAIYEFEINVVLDGTKLYFKTDAFEEIGKNDENISAISNLFAGDEIEWMSIDLEKLDIDMTAINALVMAASGETLDVKNYLESYINIDGDAQYATAMALARMGDIYELINDKLVIEETEDGYSASLDIAPEDFANISLFDGNDAQKLGVKLTSDVSSEQMTGEIEMTFSNDVSAMTVKINEKGEKADESETIIVPDTSKDITMFLTIMSRMGQ